MTCASCYWSEYSPKYEQLWCRKGNRPARAACAWLVYEPGTDELEGAR